MTKNIEKKQEGIQAPCAHVPVNLNGEYRFKIDGKGRVNIPSKFRAALSKELVVVRELSNECLYVFENADYEEWIDKLFAKKFGEFDDTNPQHLRLRLKLKSLAKDVEIDSTGRIMLSGEARSAVGIDKEVVVVGNTGRFEIWDATRYDAAMEDTDLSVFYQ